jgi:hypothetical protein
MQTIRHTIARYVGFAETSLAQADNLEVRAYFINNVLSTYPRETPLTELLFRAAFLPQEIISTMVP